MRLAPSLVNKHDATHRAALKAGYSWATIEWALASAAQPWAQRVKAQAEGQLADVWQARAEGIVGPGMRDAEIRAIAERRAEVMARKVFDLGRAMTPDAMLDWLNAEVTAMQGRPFEFDGCHDAGQLAGFLKRAQCPLYWRRCLRRAVVRATEEQACRAGRIGARARQWYATDDTVRRRIASNERNAAILAGTVLENDAGQEYTLAALVEKSPAAKHIRRGELMTRIRGCEEWATALGWVGIFTTNTCPSRFHSQTMHDGPNPKWDGSMPADAQRWLCGTWAKARAALARAGVQVFGFRVAEPHHDGCPHWHMLLWVAPEQREMLEAILRAYWLKDSGQEAGAAEHRFKAKLMTAGDACGYVAKYIAKNIDDAGAVGVEGHHDDGAVLRQDDLFGAPVRRVEAWASAHRIRQFQAIGQPPVTVWRELRRVDAQTAEGGTLRLRKAWAAVHRHEGQRADWRAYMEAQGGPGVGRDYCVRIAVRTEEREGRYETTEAPRPIGVYDAQRPGEWLLSNRRRWKPRGQWLPGERGPRPRLLQRAPQAPLPPRTRFINCTRGNFASVVSGLLDRLKPASDWNVGTFSKDFDHGNDPPNHPPDPR